MLLSAGIAFTDLPVSTATPHTACFHSPAEFKPWRSELAIETLLPDLPLPLEHDGVSLCFHQVRKGWRAPVGGAGLFTADLPHGDACFAALLLVAAGISAGCFRGRRK